MAQITQVRTCTIQGMVSGIIQGLMVKVDAYKRSLAPGDILNKIAETA